MLYFANLCNIVVVGLFPAFFVFPTKCIVNVICPPASAYLEKRNSCAFFTESCGNFSDVKQQCRDKHAYLVESVTNSTYFDELCQFAKTQLPQESSFYLDAYGNENRLNWVLNNKRKGEDEGNDCLEMVVSESDCFVKDSPCNQLKWPLCEHPHVNPCVYNNGNCDGECIPRHNGDRKCVCPPDRVTVGTKCHDRNNITVIGCYEPFTYYPIENVCIWLMEEKINITNHNDTCKRMFSQNNQQAAVSNTRPALPILEVMTLVDNICPTIDPTNKSSRYYFADGTYNGVTKKFSWLGTNNTQISGVCEYLEKYPYDNYCVGISKNYDGTCCISPIWCGGRKEYGICQAQPVLFTRPDNTSTKDTCYWDNGGCLHECVMLSNGGRECKCWEGFELINDTECRYKDSCLENAGESGCPNQTKVRFDVNRSCTFLKENNIFKISPEIEKVDLNFVIFGVIVGCLILLLCCLIVLLYNRRINRETAETQSPIKM